MLIKSIIRSIFFQIVTKIFVFLFNILLARVLAINIFGEISFLLSFNLIVSILIDLGTNQFLVKNFSEKGGSMIIKDVIHIFYFKLVNSLIFLPFLYLIFHFNFLKVQDSILYFLLALPILENFINCSIAYKNAIQQFKSATLLQFYFDITRSIFVGIFFLLFSIKGYVLSAIISYAILSLIYFSIIVKQNRISCKFYQVRPYLQIYKLALPYFLLTLLTQVYFRYEIYLIKLFSNSESLGLYSASFKIYENLIFLPAAILGVILPAMNSKASEYGAESTFKYYEIIQKSNFLIIYPLSIMGIFFSQEILSFFYGYKYEITHILLIVLFLKFIILSINSIYFNQLVVYKFTSKVILSYTLALFLQTIMGYILIINYDIYGAALSSLIGEIGITISYILILKKFHFPIIIEKSMILFLLSLVVLCIFLMLGFFVTFYLKVLLVGIIFHLLFRNFKAEYLFLLYKLVPGVKN